MYSRRAQEVAHVGEESFCVRGVLGVDVLHEARAGIARRRRRELEAQLLHLVDQRLRAHTGTTHCSVHHTPVYCTRTVLPMYSYCIL